VLISYLPVRSGMAIGACNRISLCRTSWKCWKQEGSIVHFEVSIPHCSRVRIYVSKCNELYIYATLGKKLRHIYSTCQSVSLSVSAHLSICLPIHQSVCPNIRLSTRLSISLCLSTFLSTSPSTYLSVYLPTCMSIFLLTFPLIHIYNLNYLIHLIHIPNLFI
jgi:hypothetical protein